ncbi:MAG: low temperature requirement protein A, partial [Ilumatobacteraceae bacterium]
AQAALWGLAIVLDVGGPLVIDVGGWQLHAEHFAERHGLIVIIALGESIVAIGVAAEAGIDTGVVVATVLGITVAACQWWAYFDVVSIVATRRLTGLPPGREQNAMARDSYSYLHFLMVAGIVLVALGLKKTIGDVGEPLKLVTATALLGGAALYLLAHLAFRWRNVRSLNRQRLVTAVVLLLVVPIAPLIPALATVAIVAGVHALLVAYETTHFAAARDEICHQPAE